MTSVKIKGLKVYFEPTEAAREMEAEQRELDERIDSLVAAHQGDWRAAMEVLLLTGDAVAASLSYGYVRGIRPGSAG